MKTKQPHVDEVVCDRLAFVLQRRFTLVGDYEEELARIRRRIEKATELGWCDRAYIRGARYRENFHIKLDGGASVLVQIGALQPDRQKGAIRVDMNPSRLQSGDVEQLHTVMRRIVGPAYPDLIDSPLINRCDLAVDIEGASLDHLLVRYTCAQRATVIAKRIDLSGRIEGYNFGSVTSDYMTVAYDKRQERIHAGIVSLLRNGMCTESLKANCVKRLKTLKGATEKVRIEVRGKKLRGMSLWKLASLPNRFARFQIVDLQQGGASLPRLTEQAFLAMCRQNGVKAALSAFDGKSAAAKVRAYWMSRQAKWWQPDDLWMRGFDALRRSGIFPESAFVPPNRRDQEREPNEVKRPVKGSRR